MWQCIIGPFSQKITVHSCDLTRFFFPYRISQNELNRPKISVLFEFLLRSNDFATSITSYGCYNPSCIISHVFFFFSDECTSRIPVGQMFRMIAKCRCHFVSSFCDKLEQIWSKESSIFCSKCEKLRSLTRFVSNDS